MAALRIVWLGVTYPPGVGGAARYAQLMAETIDKLCLAENSVFLVEKYPGQAASMTLPNGVSDIRRLLSYRAGRPKKDALSYLLYASDSVRLLRMPWLVRKARANVIVVHGWHLLKPSAVWLLLPLLKRMGLRLVVDLRDCYLGTDRLHRLDQFDGIICCGRNVENMVRTRVQLAGKAHYVPVPMDKAFQEKTPNSQLLCDNQISPQGYIFSPNGVSDAKRFGLLYDAWRELTARDRRLDLVIAGRPRDWRKRYEESSGKNKLVLLGNVDTQSLNALYADCAIAVNVSNDESFGRVPLEAYNLDIPMILPSGVDEFAHLDSEFITPDDPSTLADQIETVVSSGRRIKDYGMGAHDAEDVCKRTVEILSEVCQASK